MECFVCCCGGYEGGEEGGVGGGVVDCCACCEYFVGCCFHGGVCGDGWLFVVLLVEGGSAFVNVGQSFSCSCEPVVVEGFRVGV